MRTGWRAALAAAASLSAKQPFGSSAPRVFYGGARSGNVGGTLVKIQHLQTRFPEHLWRFNTLYTMSNTPYLTRGTLDRLKRRGVVMVHNQNGVYYPRWYAGDWRAENERMSHSYHSADYVFWQSAFCRRCADRFLGEREGAGEVLFNATDLDHYRIRREALPMQPYRFLMTGKFSAQMKYRLTTALQALSYCVDRGNDFALEIAGWIDGSVMHEIKGEVSRGRIAERVTFRGEYTQASAPSIYQSVHAYLATTHMDACPNSVIEALACGLPVAYLASGGVPEMVTAAAGVGVAVDEDFSTGHTLDISELGEAMIEVSNRHEAMSAAARERAEEAFDLRNWIDRHENIIRTHLEQRA